MSAFGYIRFDKEAARLAIVEELQALQQRIADNMQAAGEVASGRTIKSMHVTTKEDEGTLWGRAYFGVLETGRRAGGVPKGFQGILLQWMRDKGLHGRPLPYKTDRPHKYTPQERGDRAMASAIAWTIEHKGSKLFRTGGRADIYSKEIPTTLQNIDSRIFRLVHTAVESIKLNNQKFGG